MNVAAKGTPSARDIRREPRSRHSRITNHERPQRRIMHNARAHSRVRAELRLLSASPVQMPSPSPRSVLLLGSNTVGGGAERFVTDFAQMLATHGDLPHLATLFACEPVSDDYPTISLGHDNVFSSWRTVQRLGKLIDQHRFDFVISNGRYTGQFAAAALRKRQSRWISRIGSPYQNARGGIKEHLGRRYFQRVARRADAFVCNSHGLSEDLLLTLPNPL